ncbi:MAG: TonB-dependent receptor [Candidatus Thiodiazotropha sp.]
MAHNTTFANDITSTNLTDLSIFNLSQITVKSTAFLDQSLDRFPGTAYVFNQQDILLSPARSVSDLLQFNVPGSRATHGVSGPQLGMRGIQSATNTTIRLMLDGQSLNHYLGGGANTDITSSLLGDLQQVEVITGPGSAIHGSGALLGYINLVPKNGHDNPGTFTRVTHGFAESLNQLELGHGFVYGDNRHAFLYAGVVDAQGHHPATTYRDQAPPGTFFFDNEILQGTTVGGYERPHYKLLGNWRHDRFSLLASHRTSRQQLPNPGAIERSRRRDSLLYHELSTLRPKYRLSLDDTDTLEFSVAFSETKTGIDSRGPTELTGFAQAEDGLQETRERYSNIKILWLNNRFVNHELTLGVEAGRRSQSFQDEFSSVRWSERSIFFEDIFTPSAQWKFIAGLRWDSIKYSKFQFQDNVFLTPFAAFTGLPVQVNTRPDDETNLSPHLALDYKLTPLTRLCASYQRGFRFRETPQLFYYSAIDNIFFPNNGVAGRTSSPDVMESVELTLHSLFPKQGLDFDLTLYYNKYDFSIYNSNQVPGTNFPSLPSSSLELSDRTFGIEPRIQWQASTNLNMQLAYSYFKKIGGINQFITMSDLPFLYNEVTHLGFAYPISQLKLNAVYSKNHWNIHFNVTRDSARYYSVGFNNRGLTPDLSQYGRENSRTGAYTTFNFQLNYLYDKNTVFSIGGKNILGDDSTPLGYYEESLPRHFGELGTDERLFYIGADITF